MGLHISVESWKAVRPYLKPLFVGHHQEIAADQDRIPLDVDWSRYDAMDAAGKLAVVAARRDGRLCGYAIGAVDTHLHYKSTVFGFVTLYYLHPAERAGWAGIRLLRSIERALKDRGALKISAAVTGRLDTSPVFKRLGWTPEETHFVKWIG